jgi:YD repeat-containing protein
MGEYVPGAGKGAGGLPGMGGVFNSVNLHTYHYAGNNPVKYTDPDGRFLETGWDLFSLTVGLASLKINLDNGDYLGAGLDLAGIAIDIAASVAPGIPGGASVAIKAARAAVVAANVTRSTIAAVKDIQNDKPGEAALEIAGAALSIAAVGMDIKGSSLLEETTMGSGTLARGASNMPAASEALGSYGTKVEQARVAGNTLRTSSAVIQTTLVVDDKIRGPATRSSSVQSQGRPDYMNKVSMFLPGVSPQYKSPFER